MQRSPYTEKLLHRGAFTHSKLAHTQRAFTHSNLLHREDFTHSNTEKLLDLGAKVKKDDIEALFKRNCTRKITSAKIEKICWQITIAALMQPFRYDLRSPTARDTSITHSRGTKQLWRSHYNAICRDWVAKTQKTNARRRQKLQLKNRISAPKQKITGLKHFLKGIQKEN